MAIEYKNVVTSVTTTGSDQTIYTCPTSTNLVKYSAIVKTFTVLNTTAGAGTLDIKLTDTSATSTVTIREYTTSAFAANTTVDLTDKGPIVLESADVLKIDTSVQPANVYISVMEISDELRGL